MTEIQNGIYATPTDELTALALEARKRKISYGQLVSTTTAMSSSRLFASTALIGERRVPPRRRKPPKRRRKGAKYVSQNYAV